MAGSANSTCLKVVTGISAGWSILAATSFKVIVDQSGIRTIIKDQGREIYLSDHSQTCCGSLKM